MISKGKTIERKMEGLQHHLEDDQWLFEFTSRRPLVNLNLKEVWQYRDLLQLFVRRDLVTIYKQTLLGPLWYLFQPIMVSVVFTLVFNNIAGMSTGKLPSFLFNLAGVTAWNYFAHCLKGTSGTFRTNIKLFGKVYFPRVLVPLSLTISNLTKFGIQLLVFIFFYLYFLLQGFELKFNPLIVLLPAYVFMMALLGMGLGMMVASFTIKYRDLLVMMDFFTSILLYASVVPYPMSEVSAKLPGLGESVKYNPLAQIIEGMRFLLLNEGWFSWTGFAYAFFASLMLFLLGMILFNRATYSFIDVA